MHPIMFRIPLPGYTLPLLPALLVVAGVALALAVWRYLVGDKENATFAGGVGVVAAIAGVSFRGETWDMAPVPIYSYGVMLGLSLVVGWYLTLGLAEKDGLPKETMANNYMVTALAALVGARLLYVLTNLDEFSSLGQVFALRRGGLVAYGGFLGGFLGSWLFLRRHNLRLLPWADVAVPSLASGLLITRVGCYLFGCDFGKRLGDGAPGWLQSLGSFPHWPPGTLPGGGEGAPAWAQHRKLLGLPPDATHSFPVHPTQLYESLVGLGLLGLLLWARKRQAFRGQIFLLFTFAYGVARFLLEILRDDDERGSFGPAVGEHVLLGGALALLAVGFVVGFSKSIENLTARRVAQVAAFLPAVWLYVALRPETFSEGVAIQLSTSQGVGLVTALAASFAYSIYHVAARTHPEAAMALGLPEVGEADPPAQERGRRAGAATEGDETSPRPPKKGKKKRKKVAAAPDGPAGSPPEDRKPEPDEA